MRIRAWVFGGLLCAVACTQTINRASATDSKAPTSDGLTANVMRLVHTGNDLSVQLVIKNDNKVRVYLIDARADDSQLAFLGSGDHLQYPFPSGIPFCNSSYATCVANPNEMNLDKFSYIEPGSALPIAMKYTVLKPIAPHDTISFSVTFIAAFAKSDVTPENVGHWKRVTFPFIEIPLPDN